ncbi:MAG: hypothetical protein R3C05_23690 [Pirellulaceae bacterium]
MGLSANLRLRPDLVTVATVHRGRRYHLIRDPLARKVLRISESDYQQLQSPLDADETLVAELAQQNLLLGLKNALDTLR